MEFCVSNIRKIAIIWDFFVILIKKVSLQSGVANAFCIELIFASKRWSLFSVLHKEVQH